MNLVNKPSNNNQDIEINNEMDLDTTNFNQNNKLKEVILIMPLLRNSPTV
jgi:hypothetical protein